MSTKIRVATVIIATLCMTASGVAATGDGTGNVSSHHRHGPGGMHGPHDQLGGGFMAALRELNLTDQQKQSIKSLMTTARQQMQATLSSTDIAALNNPGDPNYARAVQDAQNAAANRVLQRSNIEQQIYNLLSTDQKNQLPKALAQLKTTAGQHHGGWKHKGSQSDSASGA
jgi:periplasmic protein CpxP/Spy